jgi:hypothetical protein
MAVLPAVTVHPLWHLTMAIRTVTVALNGIHGRAESRPPLGRLATLVALAV